MKKKKKKKRLVFMSGTLILIIIVALLIAFVDKPDNTMKTRIIKINDLITTSASKNSILKVIEAKDIDAINIMTGPDSYIRQKPNSKIINENNLQSYVVTQNKLSERIEKRVINSLDYSIADMTTVENNARIYHVRLKTYYQMEYIQDLRLMTDELLKRVIVENEEVDRYKAKIIAMKVLDKKLKEYENIDEYCVANVYKYSDSKESTATSLKSYLAALQGVNYNNDRIIELEETRETRINDYIEQAIEEKIIDKDNILNNI